MSGTVKPRDTRLDGLRVAGAFAVVVLHVSVRVLVTDPDWRSLDWWAGNVAHALVHWGVPVFVMVSGALLLSQPSNTQPLQFYRRRAIRLLPPLIFWTFFYLLLVAYQTGHIDVRAAAKSVLQGRPYFHLWYLYMLIGLTLLTPFLRWLVSTISSRWTVLFIVVCFVMSSAEVLASNLAGLTPVTFLAVTAPLYVGYYVAGYYLRETPHRMPAIAAFAAVIACAGLMAAGTALLLPILGERSWKIMHGNLNPLVIIMSLCIFQVAVNAPRPAGESLPGKVAALVQRLAPLSLGIYVIHPFWMFVLNRLGVNVFLVHPALAIPATSLAVFGLSALSAMALAAIPLARAVVR